MTEADEQKAAINAPKDEGQREESRSKQVGDEDKAEDAGTGGAAAQESEGAREGEAASHPWQAGESDSTQHSWVHRSTPAAAVWDSTRQAWYFWNALTQETTWTNPLEGERDGGDKAGTASAGAKATELAASSDEQVAQASGIDPDLAYLDPALYAAEVQRARKGASSAYSSSGAFDSRTGKFVPLAATGAAGTHDPSRLSHANQADRQMSAFFDVQQYQEERKRDREEREREEAEGSKRRKAPTRKELQRYKERAKEKKAAKYGWLRE